MDFVLLKSELAGSLVNYLSTKPYNEVKVLIDGILQSQQGKSTEPENIKEPEILNQEEKKITKGK